MRRIIDAESSQVAQNAARIARALLDIAVFRKSSQNFASLLALAKAIDSEFCVCPLPAIVDNDMENASGLGVILSSNLVCMQTLSIT